MSADAQLPSDSLLLRLRKRVDVARVAQSNVSLHPDQVIALVEIAEAAKEGGYCDERGCRLCAALKKLEDL